MLVISNVSLLLLKFREIEPEWTLWASRSLVKQLCTGQQEASGTFHFISLWNSNHNGQKQEVKALHDFHYFKRPFVRCSHLINIMWRCYYGAAHKIAAQIDTLFNQLDLVIRHETMFNHMCETGSRKTLRWLGNCTSPRLSKERGLTDIHHHPGQLAKNKDMYTSTDKAMR